MQSPHHTRFPPFAGLAFGILAISCASLLARKALEGAPALVVAALRMIAASAVLAPFAILHHRRSYASLSSRDFLLGVAAGVLLAAHFATWIASLQHTSVINSVVLVSTAPLFVALGSRFLLRESIPSPAIGGMLAALAGCFLIAFQDAGSAQSRPHGILGDALALTGAATVGAHLLIGRNLRAKLPLVPYATLVYGSAALTLLLACLAAGKPILGHSNATYLWIVLLGLGPQLLGHSAYNWALAFLPPTTVAVAMLGEPVGSSLLAFLVLGETPGIISILGAALILGGILASTRSAPPAPNPNARES